MVTSSEPACLQVFSVCIGNPSQNVKHHAQLKFIYNMFEPSQAIFKKHVRYSERLPMLNWWYGLHSKAHVPPRRWKLNDCTSNAFYFDFNQHVQKLLDKETTKCLFQKWFPIFIIALTLAGVRPSRRHFSMRCQKRIRASYMRLSEEQVHENVPHTTHSN